MTYFLCTVHTICPPLTLQSSLLISHELSCSLTEDYGDLDLHYVSLYFIRILYFFIILFQLLFHNLSHSICCYSHNCCEVGVYVADSYITPPYAAMRKWVKGSAMS